MQVSETVIQNQKKYENYNRVVASIMNRDFSVILMERIHAAQGRSQSGINQRRKEDFLPISMIEDTDSEAYMAANIRKVIRKLDKKNQFSDIESHLLNKLAES